MRPLCEKTCRGHNRGASRLCFYIQRLHYFSSKTLDLGLTIDERLADGYYYSKSIRLLKYLLEHPEELEKPLKEEVSYE